MSRYVRPASNRVTTREIEAKCTRLAQLPANLQKASLWMLQRHLEPFPDWPKQTYEVETTKAYRERNGIEYKYKTIKRSQYQYERWLDQLAVAVWSKWHLERIVTGEEQGNEEIHTI